MLGRRDFRDAVMDQSLVEELYSHRREIDGFRTVLGGTLCTDDFYEGKGCPAKWLKRESKTLLNAMLYVCIYIWRYICHHFY